MIIKRLLTGALKIITLSFVSLSFVNSAFADNMNANVSIRPSMTFTIPVSSVSMNLNPATKPFDTKNIPITVGTNNPTGYQVFVSATGTDLTNTDDSSETIPTLTSSGAYDATSFPADYWGYKINTGNYTPFASGNVVSSATGPINEKTDNMTVAAKIDYLQPQGTYEIQLNFKIVPIVLSTYMQDITPDMCTEEPSAVMDSRDSQIYLIQRLADGRCWMLDNLRLGYVGTSITLKNTDTNMTANSWTLPASISSNFYSYTAPRINADYKTVKAPEPNVGVGSNLIGVYYNYCAATAGTYCVSSSSSGNASQDICPKGWNMPSGNTSGNWQVLYNTYGNHNVYRTELSSPLSGWFGNDAGWGAHGQGSYALYWTTTYHGPQTMYRSVIFLGQSQPSGSTSNDREYGFSIRCILKES